MPGRVAPHLCLQHETNTVTIVTIFHGQARRPGTMAFSPLARPVCGYILLALEAAAWLVK